MYAYACACVHPPCSTHASFIYTYNIYGHIGSACVSTCIAGPQTTGWLTNARRTIGCRAPSLKYCSNESVIGDGASGSMGERERKEIARWDRVFRGEKRGIWRIIAIGETVLLLFDDWKLVGEMKGRIFAWNFLKKEIIISMSRFVKFRDEIWYLSMACVQ